MYVVTGATGNTGKIVAERLLALGQQVRVVVRHAEKAAQLAAQGAEVAIADLNDERALEQALRGAHGLYYISPPDLRAKSFIAERKQLTERIAKLVVRAGVGHVVLLSSIAAHHPSGTGPIVSTHNAEQQLLAAGVASTFVRAAYFVENWAAVLPAAKQDGVLPAFFPADLRIPMVATPDIGEVAAQALLDGPRGVRVIELSGPEDASPNDVARAVGQLLGRSVSVAEAPLDAVVPTFTGFGMSTDFAQLFRELYAGIQSGRVRWEGGSAEAGRGARSGRRTVRQILFARGRDRGALGHPRTPGDQVGRRVFECSARKALARGRVELDIGDAEFLREVRALLEHFAENLRHALCLHAQFGDAGEIALGFGLVQFAEQALSAERRRNQRGLE
jgi:uncharacterized protein YbjT (DUF2867 family)